MASNAKFREDDKAGYRVEVIGRGVEVTDGMRDHIWGKLDKIGRFHNHILHVQVTLEVQKLEQICTMLIKVDHLQIKVKADSSDMYVSIDKAIAKLQALLAKYKGRIQDHHKKKLSMVDMQVNVLHGGSDEVEAFNAEIEAEKSVEFVMPRVVGKETTPLKTLRVDEAVMKLDLSGEPFLLFRSEEDQKLKLLYTRKDGNYGLIQPE